ncbi:MAG TPA: APC family permease [Solirubrobacteraceae bacterium]|jgi:basic amino acid/polyamine antiporter, APA family|nr:APC family permease [Solirubrobacteraceae bacterium]
MATADVSVTGEAGGESSLFVRKATGLVRGWSAVDGYIYAFYACNIVLGILTLAYGAFIPGGSVFWAIIITTALVLLECVVYAALTSAIPRAGGDYVWQTRIFNSPVGFVLAATGWWFILWHWIPIYANLSVISFVDPVLRIVGANGTVSWLSTKTGIFVAALIVIAVTTVYVASGMRGYAKFQRWTFGIGLLGLAAAAIILLLTSHGTFVTKFDHRANSLYGVHHAYDKTMSAGAGSYGTAMSGSLGDTLKLVPFMLFWLLWPNWGATLAGEVRGARDFRKNMWAMSAALLTSALIGLLFVGAISRSLGWHFFMASSTAYYGGTSPLGGDYLSPVALATWMIGSPVLEVIILTAVFMLVLGWYGTVFLSSTRVIFAAAFDRVLPEAAASVNPRTRVPNVALALMVIPSVIVSALYAYWHSFEGFTLDATVVIAVTYLGSTIAAMVMPWRLKRIYQSSPLAQYKVGSVPIITVVSAAFATFLILNLVWWLKDGVYGVNNTKSLVYMGILYAIAAAIWIVAWAVRRAQGMGLESVAREIPVE